MLRRQDEIAIASIFLILGLLTVLVWIPQDIDTWMIEKFRRQTTMGDAFLPMIAAVLIVLCSAVQLVLSVCRDAELGVNNSVFDAKTMAFLLQLFGIAAVSLAIMFWAGPIAVELFAQGDGSESVSYRQMRGTYPYKLIGFILGGFTLVYFTTVLVSGRFKLMSIVTSLLVVLILIAVFDLPLDNVLLMPNGDW